MANRSRGADLPTERLADAMAQVAFVTMAILSKLGSENDLSLTQLRVFGILRDRRFRMAALAGYLGLEKSTMTGLVDRAEMRGLMARAPSEEDARATDVFLTKQGLALAERLEGQFREALAPLTESLEAPEQRRLEELLSRMLETPEDQDGTIATKPAPRKRGRRT